MKHIYRQFAASVTALKAGEFTRASMKLALLHTLGVLVILLCSSALVVALYTPLVVPDNLEPAHRTVSLYEVREHLVEVIILVDIIALVVVLVFSYFDARRTLRPIERMYRQQEQFLGDVAHELRTPLTVMKAGAEALLRQERSSEMYQAYLVDTREEIDRMTALVNDLLFLLQQKSVARASLYPVDIGQIASKQAQLFQPYATERDVRVAVASPSVWILGTVAGVTRIMQNLLKNAIDYNVAHGTVELLVTADTSTVTCSITDTGIGIDRAEQTKVFDRFFRADTARQATGSSGSGLGLSIVSTLVASFGGTLTLASTPGIGTTITLRFPVVQPSSSLHNPLVA